VKLQLSVPTALHSIAAYGDGYVVVNGVRHDTSVIVLPDRVVAWRIAGFDALAIGDFEMLAGLGMDMVCWAPARGCGFRIPRSCARSPQRASGSTSWICRQLAAPTTSFSQTRAGWRRRC